MSLEHGKVGFVDVCGCGHPMRAVQRAQCQGWLQENIKSKHNFILQTESATCFG